MEREIRDDTNRLMDRQNLWLLINEAFKLLNFKKTSEEHRIIYEQTFNSQRLKLQTIHSNIDKTVTFS